MMLGSNAIYLLSAILAGGGTGLMYFILRGRQSYQPQGALEWVGVTLASLAILFAVAVSLQTLLSGDDARATTRGVIGSQAPELRFRMVDSNQEKALSDYRGRVVLLNLWATWCPPCLDELPELNRLQEAYRPDGLVVVTISDEHRETIQRFEREQLQLKTVSGYLPQDREWPPPYDRVLDSRPMSFVIDREGIIQNMWSGAEDFAAFERAVTPFL